MGRIEITLKGKKRPIPEPRKGPILPVYDPEYLPRRPFEQFLQLYDMGRKWNGSAFIDVDWTITTTHSTDISGTYDSNPPSYNPAPLASLDALRAAIIDYDIEDIEDMHPRIDLVEGDYLNIAILNDFTLVTNTSDDADWTNEGWKLSEAELATTNFRLRQVGSGSVVPGEGERDDLFFMPMVLTGASKDKITNEYNPAGAIVAYTPKLGDKIFLMPSVVKPNCKVEYIPGVGFDYLHYLSADWTIVKRNPILDDDASEHYLQMVTVPNTTTFTTGAGELIYAQMLRVCRYFTTFFDNLWSERFNLLTSTWTAWGDPTDYPPAAVYDSPPSDPVGQYADRAAFHQTLFHIFSISLIPTNALKAVIKRGVIIFYVWEN